MTEPMSDERRRQIDRYFKEVRPERTTLTARLMSLELAAEVDRQAAELERLRPIVDAAEAWRKQRVYAQAAADQEEHWGRMRVASEREGDLIRLLVEAAALASGEPDEPEAWKVGDWFTITGRDDLDDVTIGKPYRVHHLDDDGIGYDDDEEDGRWIPFARASRCEPASTPPAASGEPDTAEERQADSADSEAADRPAGADLNGKSGGEAQRFTVDRLVDDVARYAQTAMSYGAWTTDDAVREGARLVLQDAWDDALRAKGVAP